MNLEQIRELLLKIPTTLMLVAYLGYLGFDFYQFFSDPSSTYLTAKRDVETYKTTNLKLEAKLKELNEFVKSLESKKADLRKAALELQELKGSIPEAFDVPRFMEMTLTEAKKAGMKVLSLSPNGVSDKEYYSEIKFSLNCKGVFTQLLIFLERMSSVTEIVRVDSFRVTPLGSTSGRFTELSSELELKTYKYLGSKADSVAKADQGDAPASGSRSQNSTGSGKTDLGKSQKATP